MKYKPKRRVGYRQTKLPSLHGPAVPLSSVKGHMPYELFAEALLKTSDAEERAKKRVPFTEAEMQQRYFFAARLRKRIGNSGMKQLNMNQVNYLYTAFRYAKIGKGCTFDEWLSALSKRLRISKRLNNDDALDPALGDAWKT